MKVNSLFLLLSFCFCLSVSMALASDKQIDVPCTVEIKGSKIEFRETKLLLLQLVCGGKNISMRVKSTEPGFIIDASVAIDDLVLIPYIDTYIFSQALPILARIDRLNSYRTKVIGGFEYMGYSSKYKLQSHSVRIGKQIYEAHYELK